MAIKKRKYKDYESYIKHQSAKLDIGISKKIKKFMPEHFESDVRSFKKRFELFKKYLIGENILCLGARLGAEVKCLRDMGFDKSLGIDLNPGPDNKYVIKGDFNKMDFNNESFDTIYSNSIDHTWDLSELSKEVSRILRKDRYLILEVDHIISKNDKLRHGMIKSKSKYESIVYDSVDDIIKELKEFSFVEKFTSANKGFMVMIFKKC